MINRSVLVGRLTRDVDLRYTAGGTAVGNFTIAVDRQLPNSNGRIQTLNSEYQQGQRVYVTEVVVDNFALLEPKSANANNSTNPQAANPNSSSTANNSNPTTNDSKPEEDPFADNTEPINISDDDLPF